ncbi:hypothetical protein B0A48_04378 [Cryoendolithus antarcticus]|uniref:BRCT domain-containing protein n=1 Tax=Cryoendolithus antarcticus TaxID=1507870 RepID=A0A1V8TFM2_9PEZI|nr:hypothetical protein B0A48_04378 [Cryoendolithus antarcticus]
MAKDKHFRNLHISVLWPNLNCEYLTKRRTTDVPRWIEAGSGTLLANKLSDATTHLVCSKEMYQAPHDLITEAKKRNEAVREAAGEGEKPEGLIKILGADWLEKSLDSRKRLPEGLYMWEKILAPKAAKTSDSTRGRGMPSLLTGAFFEATDEYLNPEVERKLAIAQEQRERLEAKEAFEEKVRLALKRDDDVKKRKEYKALRRGGYAKAGEEYWGKWKVYVGDGGERRGQVVLWSAKLIKGVVEKGEEVLVVVLQIHESKPVPGFAKQYSTNIHFEGTPLRKRNNIMACSGASLATAKRFFENAFLELTGVRWANRNHGPDERRSSELIKLERRMFKYQGDEEVPGANAGGAIELDFDDHNANLSWPVRPKSPNVTDFQPMPMEELSAATPIEPSDGASLTGATAEPGKEPSEGDFSANTTIEQLGASLPTFDATLTQDKNYDWSAGINFETQPPTNFYDPGQTFTPSDPFDFNFDDPDFTQHASFFAEDGKM